MDEESVRNHSIPHHWATSPACPGLPMVLGPGSWLRSGLAPHKAHCAAGG